MSNYSSSILPQEVHDALAKAENAIASASLTFEQNKLYAIDESSCGKDVTDFKQLKCLYIYAYYLDYLLTNQSELVIDEMYLIDLLALIETTSKSCCP